MNFITEKLRAVANLGVIGYANSYYRQRVTPGDAYRLRSRYAQHPIWVRPNTSDLQVFWQIFRSREYRCLDGVKKASLIIDCGANVGYSSAYFLSRFPRAKLVAIEPDKDNFAALQKNLQPYPTAVLLHSGVWSTTAGLVMAEQGHGEGQEWARTVREARPGETPMMKAVDIGSTLQNSGEDRISILKIDIEGAERELFSRPVSWLSKVDNLVIELHGPECERVFHAAIAHESFDVSTCDELTVCRRRD
jgi:FkbM family methyltransferase